MARKSRARRAALHGPAGASLVRGASMRDFSVPTRSAEDGYRVTPGVAWDWARNQWKLQDPITAAVMLPGGKPPAVGDRMRNPALAATLRQIGREGREAFYSGSVMHDILGRLKELHGLHEEEDFAAQRWD